MRLINCESLTVGMKLAEPVYGSNGQLLLQPGVCLNERFVGALREQNLPAVYISDSDTDGIVAPQPIKPETRAAARKELSEVFAHFTPLAEDLKKQSIDLTHEHASSDRFVNAVQAAFGSKGIASLEATIDRLVSDLLSEHVLVGLNSIKCHDAYTFQHSIDVTIMGVVLARKAGWDSKKVKAFGIGCLLHDIGKVMVSEDILNSPGRLSDAEFDEVKRHPFIGYQMVKAMIGEKHALIPQVALQHHERQDGSGYPRGLEGTNTLGPQPPKKIHDFGAIAAVADVYDAMSSTRSYRTAWSPDRVAATIVSLSGTHLNRQAVDLFITSVAPYPVCSEVTFVNGKYAGWHGIIARVDGKAIHRPVIRVLSDANSSRVEPFEVDLNVDQDVEIQSRRTQEPSTESMGGRRKAARVDDLPPEVISALQRLRDFTPAPSKLGGGSRQSDGGHRAA